MLNVKKDEKKSDDGAHPSPVELELHKFAKLALQAEKIIRKQRLELAYLEKKFKLSELRVKERERRSLKLEEGAKEWDLRVLEAEKKANIAEKAAKAANMSLAEIGKDFEEEKNENKRLISELKALKTRNTYEVVLKWAQGQLWKRRPPTPSLPKIAAKRSETHISNSQNEHKNAVQGAGLEDIDKPVTLEAKETHEPEILNCKKSDTNTEDDTMPTPAYKSTTERNPLSDSNKTKKKIDIQSETVHKLLSPETSILAKRTNDEENEVKQPMLKRRKLNSPDRSVEESKIERDSLNSAISSGPGFQSNTVCNQLLSNMAISNSSDSEDCFIFPFPEDGNIPKKKKTEDSSLNFSPPIKAETKNSSCPKPASMPVKVSTSMESNTSLPSNIPCVPFGKGYCANGTNCRFSHSNSAPCRFFASGACALSDKCQFAHTLPKVFDTSGSSAHGSGGKFLNQNINRYKDPFYKTRRCKYSPCPYGNSCNFIHDASNPSNTFKRTICRQFQISGTCKNGTGCNFIHTRSTFLPSQASGGGVNNQRKAILPGNFGVGPTIPTHIPHHFNAMGPPMFPQQMFPRRLNNGFMLNQQKQLICSVCTNTFQGTIAFNKHLTESGHRKS